MSYEGGALAPLEAGALVQSVAFVTQTRLAEQRSSVCLSL